MNFYRMKKPASDFKIGDQVYYRLVYEHRERMEVVGITETEIKLRGDFSGGTHSVSQESWLPIKGTSRIYNHDYNKARCRKTAIAVETLAMPALGSTDPAFVAMLDLANMVMHLTAEIELNPEY